jgi:predicted GH43/DUF377 family glycosyl hydrolase
MHAKIPKNVVRRCRDNPLFGLRDVPFAASDVYNAACIRQDDEYHLLVTIEHLEGDCGIYRARSEDGRSFTMDEEPLLSGRDEDAHPVYESHGVRDARVTRLEDECYICYLAQSQHGVRLAMARTNGTEKPERLGLVSQPDTKGGSLFPRKIKGKYARLERPREGGNIWISYSEDLLHWGGWECVMTPRHGYWDYHRIGTGCPPIYTPDGWLIIYYGVRQKPNSDLFRLGAAFLDLDEPTHVLGRSNVPILAPSESYERLGDVQNIVFTCGAMINEEKNDLLEIYYGAADSCICLGTVPLHVLNRVCFGS